MAQRVHVFAPDGTPGTVPANEVEAIKRAGGRVMSSGEQAEEAKPRKQSGVDLSPSNIAETYAAGLHADVRGVAGAFGVPVDKAATGIAEMFGGEEAGKKTANYLKELEEKHPIISGWMEGVGGMRGAIGAAELAGAPTSVTVGAPRTAAGFAARMGYGGMENVVQSTTRDINEDAIGKASPNGEKLWAQAPKHFLVGAGLTGLGEGLGMAAESGVASLTRKAEPALERGASAALGKELGETGDAAVAAGQKIRGASRVYEGTEIPVNRGALMSVLEAEQGSVRREATQAHAARLSALEGEQTTKAGQLSIEQEAARKAGLAKGAAGVREARFRGSNSVDSMRVTGAHIDEEAIPVADRLLSGSRADAWEPMMHAPEGYAMKADRIVREGNSLEFYGRADTAAGGFAGEYGFTLSPEKGRLVAKLDNLLLEEGHQGRGLGAVVAKNMDETWARLGVNEARLDASNVGRYVWAKQGYEWAPETGRRMEADFGKWLSAHGHDPAEAAVARGGAKALADTPNGKAFLLSDAPNWRGSKQLAGQPEGIASQIRARKSAMSQAEEELTAHYDSVKMALREEKAAAETNVRSLAQERTKAEGELKSLTESLRKKGHGSPEAEYDIFEAADIAAGFMGKGRGAMTGMVDKHLAEAFEKRAESMLGGVSKSTGSELEQLTGMSKSLRQAHQEAERHLAQVTKAEGAVDGEMAQRMAQLQRQADKDLARIGVAGERSVAGAEKQAAREASMFEKGAAKDRAKLGKAQEKEVAALGEAETKTYVDPLIEGAKKSAATAAERPIISSSAGLGAVLSLAHGNPFAAVGGVLSSIAAGRLRGNGNLLTAQALAGVASKLRTVDKAVKNGAASIFGRSASLGAEAGIREIEPTKPPKKDMSFEKVSKSVLAAKGNPQLVERQVQAQYGALAKDAPSTYAATLATALRAQEFLASKLPEKQIDPKNLRPDLQKADVSDTEKYDFLQYAKALSDPLDVFRDVKNGTVTEQQVEAIKHVAPDLFSQMQDEVRWQAMMSTSPLDYEQEVHLGTLLEVETDTVLAKEFQTAQADMFVKKEEDGASANGSREPSDEGRVAKDLMSTSQSVERGD